MLNIFEYDNSSYLQYRSSFLTELNKTCCPCLESTESTSSYSEATTQPGTSISSGAPETSHGSPATPGTSEGTSQGSEGTISATPSATTGKFCEEMEYINTLIATHSIETQPTPIPNKEDLITKGVDFTDTKPIFVIDIPEGGAIVRDIDVFSSNVAEIVVVFITESGRETTPIQGGPTSLPTTEFPTEKVSEIVIKVKETTDNSAPQDVTLSVIACAEGTTVATSQGKASVSFR